MKIIFTLIWFALVGVFSATARADMANRWSFNGASGSMPAGTNFTDPIGGAVATVRGNGATASGSAVTLPGSTTGNQTAANISAYIDLPNGIISSKPNLTVEAWIRPVSSKSWQVLFDFGRANVTRGPGAATGEIVDTTSLPGNYRGWDIVTLTLNNGLTLGSHYLVGKISNGTAFSVATNLSASTSAGTEYHYVLTVLDGIGTFGAAGCRAIWYRNGVLQATLDLNYRLTQMADVNNWIGRPLYGSDSCSNIAVNELRIYNHAMSAAEVAASYAAGANPSFVPPTAVPDTATMHRGQKNLIAVLANDTGSFIDATVTVLSPPAFGTAVPDGQGRIRYTHTAGTPTSDSFTYRVSGPAGASSPATVTINFSNSLRIPNSNLNVPSSPPPLATTLTPAFTGLTSPVCMAGPPGDTQRLFVCQKGGLLRVVQNVTATTPVISTALDLAALLTSRGEALATTFDQGFLNVTFHPNYATNRYFYVFYSVTKSGAVYQRVSRFTMQAGNPNAADTSSELVLIEQLDDDNGHEGSDLHFGPDGYLYISVGDEGLHYDGNLNAQRIDRDFFSGILRIDVDKKPGSLAPTAHPAVLRDAGVARYAVPPDNPFVGATTFNGSPINTSALRTEFWAVGMRSPWRFSFDSQTGELWSGDVGQDLYEEVNLVVKGGNYGWAYRDGNQNGPKSGSAPANFDSLYHKPPLYEYTHTGVAGGDANFKGNSVIGGLVYRGSRFPSLAGSYIFADYVSGNVWSLTRNGANPPTVTRIAGETGIVSFGTDPSTGDVLLADFDGNRILRLTIDTPVGTYPATLSETGLFADLADLSPAPGLLPYAPNLPFWSDHGVKRRWFAIPDLASKMTWSRDGTWTFPAGQIWVKHFDMEMARGNPATKKRIETRVLVKNATGTYGVSYRWNDAGTEATLVPDGGAEIDLAITEGGLPYTQRWRIPSRSDCLACHTPQAGHALSFNTRQFNLANTINGFTGNQIDLLKDAGYFSNVPEPPSSLPRHYRPDETDQPLETRARSYLAVNCAYCHQAGGTGAPAAWDGRPELTLAQTGLINGVASNPGGDPLNRLIVPGDIPHSIALSRIAVTNGFTRMPPIASSELDQTNITLMTDWITSLSDANLISMAPSAGVLVPAFASGTTSYSASVPNSTTSITVTPATVQPGATVTVNGAAVTSGTPSAPIALAVGNNTINTVVTAQDGLTTKTYTIVVTRAAAANADLSALAVSAGTLTPAFSSATTSYTDSVANGTSAIQITPTLADPAATATVNGAAVTSGTPSAPIALAVGNNTINTVVTAQDGLTTKTYTIVVTRAAASNADLSALAVSAGTLTPAFASATTSYTDSVANGTSTIQITPTLADPAATVTVNGAAVTSGAASAPISLVVGNNTINTVVTAQDGLTTKIYTIVVTRAAASNADLSALAVSAGTLTPAFSSATTSYTASVTNGTSAIQITPTLADPAATVTVNGAAVTSGTPSAPIALAVGNNTINTMVTAQDGLTTKTYTIVVTRAAASNADLSALAVSAGTLTPAFASATTSYTDSVANGTSTIQITPTLADPAATATVNGAAVTSGTPSAPIALAVGNNTINTVVTAQDGLTTKTYTIVVTRAAASNADLSALAVSAGTLTPAFSSATTSYTDSVANGTSAIQITPTLADPAATVTVNGAAVTSGTASAPIALVVGSNTINTVVTAQDGLTTKTYTIVVTRAAAANADLSALAVSAGTLTPAFSSATTSYTDSVANGTSAIQITPTLADPAATVKVNGVAVASGAASAPINLVVGNNTINTVVTAQDGLTTKTYTLIVIRAASSGGGMVNRWAFNGPSGTVSSGTTFTDSISGTVATVRGNGATSDSAAVTLPGSTTGNQTAANISAYIDLPNGIISSKPNVTVEAWIKPVSSKSWQVLFDFGRANVTRGPGAATGEIIDTTTLPGNYTGWDILTFTLNNGLTLGSHYLVGKLNNGTPRSVATNLSASTTAGTEYHYVMTVLDGAGSFGSSGCQVRWYRNGVLQSVLSLNFRLTQMADVNNWIGRPLYGSDSCSNIAVNELRIYNRAITATEVAASYASGANASYAPPGGSSNADLSNLVVSAGTLAPAFGSATTTYTASMDNGTSTIQFTPTVTDPTATIKINGATVASGTSSAPINLVVGSNVINTVVTAQDGTVKIYSSVISRAPSSNADLASLDLSEGSLTSAFASATTGYTASVPNGTSTIQITPTVADPSAAVSVNGVPVPSGTASPPISLAVGNNNVTTVVTAQAGTSKDYTVVVTRAASSNTDLIALVPSAGTLSPAFMSNTLNYTQSFNNSTLSIRLTPVLSDPGATVTVNGTAVASGAPSNSIPLYVGSNAIDVVVTAQDGVTTKTYQDNVTVTEDPSVAGYYTGLATPTASATDPARQVGLLAVSVLPTGTYTGKVTLGGSSVPLSFSGIMAGNTTTQEIVRAGLPTLTMTLTASADAISGSLTEGGTVVSVILLNKLLYTSTASPAPPLTNVPLDVLNPSAENGNYTGIFKALPPSEQELPSSDYPQGSGWATLQVHSSGLVTIAGKLADGQVVSYSNYLSKDNVLPFFVLPYSGTGTLSGAITFRDTPTQSDVDGDGLVWFKFENPSDASYANGWPNGIDVDFIGSKFIAPTLANVNALITLSDGSLPSALTNQLSVDASSQVTVLDPGTGAPSLELILNPTGSFTGSFLHPASNTTTSIYGVILQKTQSGGGYFLGAPPAGFPLMTGGVAITLP